MSLPPYIYWTESVAPNSLTWEEYGPPTHSEKDAISIYDKLFEKAIEFEHLQAIRLCKGIFIPELNKKSAMVIMRYTEFKGEN